MLYGAERGLPFDEMSSARSNCTINCSRQTVQGKDDMSIASDSDHTVSFKLSSPIVYSATQVPHPYTTSSASTGSSSDSSKSTTAPILSAATCKIGTISTMSQ